MTPIEFREALRRLDLSQRAAARFYGVALSTLQQWLAVGPSPPAARLTRLVQHFLDGGASIEDVECICGRVSSSLVDGDLPYGRSAAVVDLATPIDGQSMLQISRDALKAEMERK